MKNFKLVVLLPLLGFFFFNSCYEQSFITLESSSDGILYPVEIDIPLTVSASDGGSKNTCKGSLTIDDDLFCALKGYLVDMRNFDVRWVTIQVFAEGNTGGAINNLTLTAGKDHLLIQSYWVGTTYDGHDSQLIDLVQSVFDQVLPPVSATLTMEVSGETNVDADTPLNCKLTVDYAITIPAPRY